MIVVLLVVFSMVMYFMVGIPAIEGVGENVKQYDSIDESFDGSGIIDRIYKAVFMWVPLVFVGGMGVWAVAWYLNRERFSGRI